MRVLKSPAAKKDLSGHYAYIAFDSPAAAERFLAAADQTFEWLTAMPRVGRLVGGPDPRTRGLRFWPVTGFPNFLIFYNLGPGRLEIVRVLHGARDLPRALRES